MSPVMCRIRFHVMFLVQLKVVSLDLCVSEAYKYAVTIKHFIPEAAVH